jgi:hypothetical protein
MEVLSLSWITKAVYICLEFALQKLCKLLVLFSIHSMKSLNTIQ